MYPQCMCIMYVKDTYLKDWSIIIIVHNREYWREGRPLPLSGPPQALNIMYL